MKTKFIKETSTTNTGGGIYVDLVELKDGKVLSITEEVLLVWESMDAFEENGEPLATVTLIVENVQVFNVTDQIPASPVMSRAEAQTFIDNKIKLFEQQGYYKTADGRKITPSEVEFEIRTA